jgi:hypothetical protein
MSLSDVEPTTAAGRALWPGAGRSDSCLINDGDIQEVEAQARQQERERLRAEWLRRSPPCSCGLVQMMSEAMG